MLYENHVAKYTINETTEESSATYKCVAKNELGQVETACNLLIQEKPTIIIDEKYVTQTLRVESEWKITATVEGYPYPETTWYKDGTIIKNFKNITTTYEKTLSTIEISSLQRTDSGKYTIEAKNNAGATNIHTTLIVLGTVT